MRNFFLKLFYPDLYYEQTECKTCNELKKQLSIKNDECKILLDHIIKLTSPKEEIKSEIDYSEVKPIQVGLHKPWQQTKREKEKESRELANEIKKKRELELNENKIKLMTEEEINNLENEVKNAAEVRETA